MYHYERLVWVLLTKVFVILLKFYKNKEVIPFSTLGILRWSIFKYNETYELVLFTEKIGWYIMTENKDNKSFVDMGYVNNV